MTQALVSVVIPAFNAQRWIAATLSSAAAQTHTNLQIVVVDDGSTDRTSEIASEFALNDSRVLLKRQKNQGVAAARNAGIDAADVDPAEDRAQIMCKALLDAYAEAEAE